MKLPPFPRKGFYRTAIISGFLFATTVARTGGAITAIVAGILFGLLFGLAAAAAWMLSLIEPVRSTIDRMPAWAAGTATLLGLGLLAVAFINPDLEKTTLGPAIIWILIICVPVFLIRWLRQRRAVPPTSADDRSSEREG
jgi:hypothetical protein